MTDENDMDLFNTTQIETLESLRQQSTPQQQLWLSGYFYGLSQANTDASKATPSLNDQATLPGVTILVATQTGNAQQVAEQLKTTLEAESIAVTLSNVSDIKVKALAKISHLILVSSTYGEGEPPDTAAAFHKSLFAAKAPPLRELKYAVFGLGDSSYDQFCQTAIDFDTRLAELGATRLLPRVEADVEFQSSADKWVLEVRDTLLKEAGASTSAKASIAHQNTQAWSEKNPYPAEVLGITPLTDITSNKTVFHLELDIADSGIQYQPGDIAVIATQNDSELVASVIRQAGLDATETVNLKGEEVTLEQALTHKRQLRCITPKQLDAYADKLNQPSLVANTPLDKTSLNQSDVLDIFNLASPAGVLTAQDLVEWLLPLRPRQYSIASSQNLLEDELHLCIGQVVYELNGRTRYGSCSNALANLQEGDQVSLSIKPNPNFKLPEKADAPIMMVGPGTGIAPFRAFMQEREANQVKGKSWLFFGEQHFSRDFLYQVEWQKWVKTGTLEKISLAFSRDQAEKIYVQHRLYQAAAEVFAWLEAGAYFYVCGDQAKMAKDVHATLLQIVAEQGQMDAEAAEDYLQNLIQQKRYQRDVY